MAQRGAPHLLGLVDGKRPIEWPVALANAVVAGEKQVIGTTTIEMPDLLPFICWLNHDALLARIDEEIDALIDPSQALDDNARAAALAEITRDTLAVEREEEAAIVHAREEGIEIARRHDADPRAILELA